MRYLLVLLLTLSCSTLGIAEVERRILSHKELFEMRIPKFEIENASFREAMSHLQKTVEVGFPGTDLGFIFGAPMEIRKEECEGVSDRLTISLTNISLGELIVMINKAYNYGLIWKMENNTIRFTNILTEAETYSYRIYPYSQNLLNFEAVNENGSVVDITLDVMKLLPNLGYSEESPFEEFKKNSFKRAWYVPKSKIIMIESLAVFGDIFEEYLDFLGKSQKVEKIKR